jgi:hypothetical protein
MGIYITAVTPKGVFIATAPDAPAALQLAEGLGALNMTDIKLAERGQDPVSLEVFQSRHARPWPDRPKQRVPTFGLKP